MYTINNLGGHFGIEIHGLDLAQDRTEDTLRLLAENLYEHQVIVVRGQTLKQDQYLDFGRQWGTPIPHVLDHMRMAGYPEMMTVGNTEPRDRKSRIRNGAALWHTDQSYEAVPASTTMLYSIKAPVAGGETQFCNMHLAYVALPQERKAQLQSLKVKHKYGYGTRREGELNVNPLINDDQDSRVPPVLHPLVMPHPIVDREMLYALGHGAYGIDNMEDSEAQELIESLKDHVLQEKFIYRHRYAVGDVVIWDTLQTMHSATPIDIPRNEQEQRLLWRISVRNKPVIYQ